MKPTSSIIHKLDEITINRIAAGEVVQNPSSALKEMLENSLDAGSTTISVVAKGGGMALLQIQDDGHGIRKEDLNIVCERFTTSKIVCFEDLKNVTTFGFRGEALASITHVAHVVIVTKTSDQSCAYKAKYSDGKLVPFKTGEKAEPKPCAGTVGTSITVEDLFYNMSTRRKAFKNYSEQYQKILDVVTRYAIHYGDQNISFTCKKHGQASADLHTPTCTSTIGNISNIYGNILAKELLPLKFSNTSIPTNSNNEDNSSSQSNKTPRPVTTSNNHHSIESPNVPIFSCNGYVTNANYSCKKSIFILFINNRLVDSVSIKRMIESIYNDILPKHSHPFIYLSIVMPPHHVDVNVHPTKKEVHFLYEVELLEILHNELQSLLKSANNSRTFYTQSLLLPNFSTQSLIIPDDGNNSSNNDGKVLVSTITSSSYYQSNKMVESSNNNIAKVANVTQNSLLFLDDNVQVNDEDEEEDEEEREEEIDSLRERNFHRTSDTSTTASTSLSSTSNNLEYSINHTVASPDTTNNSKKRSMESSMGNDLLSDDVIEITNNSNNSRSSSRIPVSGPRNNMHTISSSSSSVSNQSRTIPANKLVRVDATSSKIDSYFTSLSKPYQTMMSFPSTSLSNNLRGNDIMTSDSDSSEVDREWVVRSDINNETYQHLEDCPIRNGDTTNNNNLNTINQTESQTFEKLGLREANIEEQSIFDSTPMGIDSSFPSSTTVGAFARTACRCCVNISRTRTRTSSIRTRSPIAQLGFMTDDNNDMMNAYNEDNDFLQIASADNQYQQQPLVLNTSTNPSKISSINQVAILENESLMSSNLKDPMNIESTSLSILPITTRDAINRLINEIKLNLHNGLHKILHCNTLVGIINSEYLLIQYSSRLLLLNFQSFSRHLFYQLTIQQMGKLPILKLENEVDVEQFLLVSLELPEAQWSPQDGDKKLLVSKMSHILYDHTNSLYELFRIGFEKKHSGLIYLTSMPELLPNHQPVPEYLPMFLLRLATEVSWTKKDIESADDDFLFIKSVALELAIFFSKFEEKESDGIESKRTDKLFEKSPIDGIGADIGTGASAGSQVDSSFLSQRGLDMLTRLVWPALKSKLVAPRECADDGSIVQIAALEQLYKIFERC